MILSKNCVTFGAIEHACEEKGQTYADYLSQAQGKYTARLVRRGPKPRKRSVRFSQHAVDQSIVCHISVQELREAIAVGEIIEDYPTDKYGPSCLIFGVTSARRPLHIQCSYPSRPLVKILTLYEPDPRRWIDGKVRRPSHEHSPPDIFFF